MPTEQEKIIIATRFIAKSLVALADGKEAPSLPEEITYRGVFSLAKKHSLAGALYNLFEEVLADDVELSSKLSRIRDIDYAKNLVQEREFVLVTRAFSDAKIRFLPMKGFLFKELWARPEHRTMSDMDIYVDGAEFERAGDVLLSLGYSRGEEGAAHDSFEKPPYVNIELHKKLVDGITPDFSNWFEREDCSGWYVMSEEDFLIYNLAHIHKHYKGGGSGIRSVFDVFLFLRAHRDTLDMSYIMARLEELSLSDFFATVIDLSELWFGDGLDADPALLEFELYTASGGTYGCLENRVTHRVKEKKESKISYVLSRTFLPYSKMVYLYKWLKPMPFLLPVAWIMRILTAIFDGRAKKELRAFDTASADNNGVDIPKS